MIVCMIACIAWVPVSAATEASVNKLPGQASQLGLSMVGEGKMTWLGFSIYKASLWTQNGTYPSRPVNHAAEQEPAKQDPLVRSSSGNSYSLPIALHIVYEKNISSETLVETTIKEWRRLKLFDDSERQYYAQQLRSIWPDVKPGDSITTVMDINQHTIFLVNGRTAGNIRDKNFGPALMAIWLHPETRATGLRASLIGLQGG
jgi:hypothetical protein